MFLLGSCSMTLACGPLEYQISTSFFCPAQAASCTLPILRYHNRHCTDAPASLLLHTFAVQSFAFSHLVTYVASSESSSILLAPNVIRGETTRDNASRYNLHEACFWKPGLWRNTHQVGPAPKAQEITRQRTSRQHNGATLPGLISECCPHMHITSSEINQLNRSAREPRRVSQPLLLRASGPTA